MATPPPSSNCLSVVEIALLKKMAEFKDSTLSEMMDALPKGVPTDPAEVRGLLDGLVSKGLLDYRGGAHDNYYLHETSARQLLAFLASTVFDALEQHRQATLALKYGITVDQVQLIYQNGHLNLFK